MRSEAVRWHSNTEKNTKLNKVTVISKIAITRVEEVLETLDGGSVYFVFDLSSGFTQLSIPLDTVPLIACCALNELYKWPRMPQGATSAPAWFIYVIRLVTASLDDI